MNASIRQDRPALGSNVIPAGHVQIVHPHIAKSVACQFAPAAASTKPQITLLKDGDVVRAIEIVCACGEVIRLDCEY